jgi:hypothetical protein
VRLSSSLRTGRSRAAAAARRPTAPGALFGREGGPPAGEHVGGIGLAAGDGLGGGPVVDLGGDVERVDRGGEHEVGAALAVTVVEADVEVLRPAERAQGPR